ncbi:MAG: restriction endonuclease subunit R [Cyanothece sp. SIO1E1]|nr:restriction endonuclease subunit R [Cyanothece sp. SIO1E1]
MIQTLKANKVTLADLKEQFSLTVSREPQFFPEWQSALDSDHLPAADIEALERVKSNFENLLEEPPLLEGAVKMVVLSRLLDLGGFYQPPFRIKTEREISIASPDPEAEVLVKGAIDVLVIMGMLWILVIESKMSDFSLTKALPQALSYMLANSSPISFGMITNGSDFVFLKLNREETPCYSTSRVFSLLTPGNELVDVLRILKYLGRLIAS